MADVIKVVDDGMSIITNRLRRNDDGTPHFLHWGVGTTDAANGDSAMQLLTNCDEDRAVGVMTQQTTNETNDTFQVVGTLTCVTATKAIQEAGLFDAAGSSTPKVGGNMFLHGTFDSISVNVADSIEFTIKVAFDQA
jgi:hypothetical protein